MSINKFKGQCACGRNVPAGCGTLLRSAGAFVVRCMDCTSPTRTSPVRDTGEACDAVFDRNLERFGSRR